MSTQKVFFSLKMKLSVKNKFSVFFLDVVVVGGTSLINAQEVLKIDASFLNYSDHKQNK